MKRLSIDNGLSFTSAFFEDKVIKAIDSKWDEIVSMMDDEIREVIHSKFAPCTNIKFLTEYLKKSENDIII